MIKLVISGACGKMGRRIADLAVEDRSFKIRGAVEAKNSPFLGKDYGEALERKRLDVNVSHALSDSLAEMDVLIEFSNPAATIAHLNEVVKVRKRLVVGTTGFSEKDRERIEIASKNIAIVLSPNMSIAVNLLFKLVAETARTLDDSYAVRISEAHHIHKKDAPSGTAKELSRIVKVKNEVFSEIPIESILKDEIVGDHTVTFESDMDRLELTNSAKSRDIFAKVALVAAKYIMSKEKGLYTMKDVLRL